MFTSTFLGKIPLTRQTRRTFNRSRAILNGPITNTFIVFFFLKPVRDNLAPGFLRALNLSPVHAQISSGSRLSCTEKNIAHDRRIMLKKKIIHRYMSAKKFLTPERFGKKIVPQYKLNQWNHPYPTPPQTFNGHVNYLGGEGRKRFELVNVIHQQNGWRAFMW